MCYSEFLLSLPLKGAVHNMMCVVVTPCAGHRQAHAVQHAEDDCKARSSPVITFIPCPDTDSVLLSEVGWYPPDQSHLPLCVQP